MKVHLYQHWLVALLCTGQTMLMAQSARKTHVLTCTDSVKFTGIIEWTGPLFRYPQHPLNNY